jgi:hypothetical protein
MASAAALLEQAFLAVKPWFGLPEREVAVCAERDWRFDYAWPARKVAVELDGGRWEVAGGRHAGDPDYEKMNAAVLLGWRLIRVTPTMAGAGAYLQVVLMAALSIPPVDALASDPVLAQLVRETVRQIRFRAPRRRVGAALPRKRRSGEDGKREGGTR